MLKKSLLIIGGTLSLALGVLGMLFPLLPTTPFLLLTAFCYVRGSARLYAWLMNNRLLGGYLRNYLQYRAISPRAKTATLLVLWISLAVSFLAVDSAVVRVILVLVGIGVTAHLLTLNTLPEEAREQNEHKDREHPVENS